MTQDETSRYPLRLSATLDEPLSRSLWLVKWLLAIPHYVVLAFLWLAFGVLSVVAFFAILVTGRYPRQLFDFNVAVMRWTWRVHYYAYAGLGTDRYPPFTLHEVPEYPAHLEVEYPQRLSHGLVLVKWLLALPHLLIVAILAGGGTWVVRQSDDLAIVGFPGGLVGLLVLIAAVGLMFSGRYPRPLFDLVVGLDRWVARVFCYVALMSDAYPPFRLDQGGHEPAAAAPDGTIAPPISPQPPRTSPVGQEPGRHPSSSHWSARRAIAVVLGAVLVCASIALMSAGGAGLFADRELREDGFLTSPERHMESSAYAVSSDPVAVHDLEGPDGLYLRRLLGDVRVRATSSDAADIFVGIAPTDVAEQYLKNVGHTIVRDPDSSSEDVAGPAPARPPAAETFWTASASGPATQTVVWKPREGTWTVVVMNASGADQVNVDMDVGAQVPALDTASIAIALTGIAFLVCGCLLIYFAALRAREVATGASPGRAQGS
jgi:hypothetical protein